MGPMPRPSSIVLEVVTIEPAQPFGSRLIQASVRGCPQKADWKHVAYQSRVLRAVVEIGVDDAEILRAGVSAKQPDRCR